MRSIAVARAWSGGMQWCDLIYQLSVINPDPEVIHCSAETRSRAAAGATGGVGRA